jgi:hypothetical protein
MMLVVAASMAARVLFLRHLSVVSMLAIFMLVGAIPVATAALARFWLWFVGAVLPVLPQPWRMAMMRVIIRSSVIEMVAVSG